LVTKSPQFDFLNDDQQYDAILYLDGNDAHWDKNPTSYHIKSMQIDKSTVVELDLAPGGGAAISIIKSGS